MSLLMAISLSCAVQDNQEKQPQKPKAEAEPQDDFMQYFKNAVGSLEKGVQKAKGWLNQKMNDFMENAQDPAALQDMIWEIQGKIQEVMQFFEELRDKFNFFGQDQNPKEEEW